MLSLVCGSVLSNQRSNHVSSKDDEQTFVVINYYFFVESCALIWACTCHTAAQRVLLALVVRFLEVFVSAASAGDASTYQTPAAACSTCLQHLSGPVLHTQLTLCFTCALLRCHFLYVEFKPENVSCLTVFLNHEAPV